jgi:FRG domain
MNPTPARQIAVIKVQNQNELQQSMGQLADEHKGKLLLFRGQRQLHEHVRSGRARPGAKIHSDVEAGWCALAQRFLRLPSPSQYNAFVKAILQHYGMATHYVDLTSELEVALWFATHDHRIQQHRYWGSSLRGYLEDIRDATKLTLTPSSKRRLDVATELSCSWPQLGNQGLFFTFATLDHDKVGGDGPPYFGVWLQRDDDLILEMPMESDEEVLTVCRGHAYFLRNGGVERQQMKTRARVEIPRVTTKESVPCLGSPLCYRRES